MGNAIHMVMIPFTGVGLHGGYRGDEWFKNRIQIFKEYTLKSLLNQTNKDFIIWFTFRPEERTNPLVAALSEYLQEHDVQYVMTFDGLMYWDDKFGGTVLSKVKNMGRVIRSAWKDKTLRYLWPSLQEILDDKNALLWKRLENSLKVLKPYFHKADWVYLSRIDSDDMFRDDYVQTIQSEDLFRGALTCGSGYIYNTTTKELAEYHPTTNPPFHTLIMLHGDFFDAVNHLNFYQGYKSHEDIRKLPHRSIGNGYYCVTTSNPKLHISTTWTHPFRGQILQGEEGDLLAMYLLKRFGL